MVDIELPPEIVDLIDSCADECLEVENQALDTLCSVELPVLGFLRDLSSQKCYFILSRLRDWFGSTPTKHHCLCLMTVTDYISCSYNNTDFYSTFIKEKQDKFYQSFFVKLSSEWKTMFFKMPFSVVPSIDQFVSLKNSLRVSFARFSKKFAFRALLDEIMTSCDEYGTKLEKHLSSLKAKQNFNIGIDILNNSTPILPLNRSVGHTVVRINSDSKSTSISVPYKVIHKPKTPTAVHNFIKDQVIKRNSLPATQLPQESKKSSCAPLLNEVIKTPPVIVINDSPHKMDRTSVKLDNITNVVSSKAIKRPAEGLKPLDLDGKVMKHENDVSISTNSPKTSLSRKLNAFDILMRRKTIKTVS